MRNLGVLNANLCTNFDVKVGLRVANSPVKSIPHFQIAMGHPVKQTGSDPL